MSVDDLPEFDPAKFLTDEETVLVYLANAACDYDATFLQSALIDVVRSPVGTSALSFMIDADREALLRTLTKSDDASLSTIMQVLAALSVSMTFVRRRDVDPLRS